MPKYLWCCEKCGKEVEVFNSVKDYLNPPEEICCKKSKFKKILSEFNQYFGVNWSDNTYKDGKGGKGKWIILMGIIEEGTKYLDILL